MRVHFLRKISFVVLTLSSNALFADAALQSHTQTFQSNKASFHAGRAMYHKGGEGNYANLGASFEEAVKMPSNVIIPYALMGIEANVYVKEEGNAMYDILFKAGPTAKSKHFVMDLQAISGIAFNAQGGANVELGGLAKVGTTFGDDLTAQIFVSRTQSFSRFGFSFAKSF